MIRRKFFVNYRTALAKHYLISSYYALDLDQSSESNAAKELFVKETQKIGLGHTSGDSPSEFPLPRVTLPYLQLKDNGTVF